MKQIPPIVQAALIQKRNPVMIGHVMTFFSFIPAILIIIDLDRQTDTLNCGRFGMPMNLFMDVTGMGIFRGLLESFLSQSSNSV